MKKFIIILSTGLALSQAIARPSRIEAFSAKKGSPLIIKISEGMGTLVSYPCQLQEAYLGNSGDFTLEYSPVSKATLFVQMKRYASKPSNLIARCERQKNFFVADLVPSRTEHQDVVYIKNLSGFVEDKDFKPFPQPRVIEISPPVLIDSSDGSHLKGKEREEFLKKLKEQENAN